MTISNTKAKSVYETNGERREWEIGFDFDSNVSKLNIILEDSEGYQTVVEDNYLIEDGVVIYPSLESELDPIAEGYKIILFRSTPNTQEIDLRDNVTEKGLDKLTLQVQELSEQVERAVKVPLVEEGVKEYQDLVLKVREERDTALEQIKEATSVVSDYTQASALNAVTSKEEADRAVEASNTSVMASADAEASAVEAANLANEAKDAVSAYVNGLGAMRNAVIDLGLFGDNQRKSSSCIIDFDFEPLDVFIRFTDSSKNMWINGAHSFAGIEKVGYRKYKIFYSISSEDFSSQSTIKGPFYVQYVIKYSVFSGKPVMYRGRVDTVDQLPAEAEDGDLWYVGPVEQSNKEEYIWQNGKWELLGSTDFTNIYTKEEIDNKVKVIEADIDANADAIQKTRNDFIASDSELQQQINAHAEELTTQKNDIDELGDEVAEIESKIPEGTSDTNQLINKQQLLKEEMELREDLNEGLSELQTQITAQATAIAGKQDKFTAGEGIKIEGNVISTTEGGSASTADSIKNQNIEETAVQPLYNWMGTKAEYEEQNIAELHPEWICFITDDYVEPVVSVNGQTGEVVIDVPTKTSELANDSGFVTAEDLPESGGASFPLFYHTFADHLLNDASWLRGDTFSWQSGDMYVSAYNHLVEEFNAIKNLQNHYFKTFAWDADYGHNVYTLSETPKVGDSAYFLGTFVGKVSNVDTTNNQIVVNDIVCTRLPEEDFDMGFDGYLETIGSTEITYYRAEDGHKIVLADQEDNVSVIYRATGVAWYYILDTENKRFKLPRTKHNFAGIRTGVGNFVEAGLPNIKGVVGKYFQGSGTANESGALYATDYVNAYGNDGSGNSGAYNLNLDASRSSSIYGNSDTVQPPSTEQYLYFYVGNTVRNQTEVDVGAVTEQLNTVAGIAEGKLDTPSLWSADDIAQIREGILMLDYDNIQTITVTSDAYQEWTAPADGIVVGIISYSGAILVNGNQYSTSTTDANWGAGYVPLQVRKGDLVKARFNTTYSRFIPYKNQSGENNLVLGLNFFGKYASLSGLITASETILNSSLGKGRWALVGDDTNGYTRYYTKPTDNTFMSFVWAEGGKDTYLGAEADYVVETYNENKLWYKKYRSGWLEQGGLFEGTFAGTYEYSLILPFQNTDYTIMGTGQYSTNASAPWVALTKTETTFKGEAFRGGSANVSLTKLYWYACGQGAF